MTTGRALRLGEALLGGGVLALGIFVAVETTQLRVGPSHATVGPTLFPYLIAAGLLVIGAMVLYQAFFGHVAHERGLELDFTAVGLICIGLLLQIVLVERLGWIVSTTLLFTIVARAFGSRRLVVDLAIGLALAVLSYVVFNWALGLTLPMGSVLESLTAGEPAP
ncbi:MAG TPA: tripartite tricarboxylate transporter TctB family protein [Geminicoccaceae bacterium]|nr:tripartite tricarboxylate transporter TctB family protein [Geminicoccus sp.]HMU49087.1 tripartite tricarboxylate transporter TctB family protein [Geminicoccaceae bacterium]